MGASEDWRGHAEHALSSAIDELEDAYREFGRLDYDTLYADWCRLENLLFRLSGQEAA